MQILSPGRLVTSGIMTADLGLVILYAVYLICAVGLDQANAEMLQISGAHVRSHGRPYIAGGDFNLNPALARGSGLLERMRGELVLPRREDGRVQVTCSSGEGNPARYAYRAARTTEPPSGGPRSSRRTRGRQFLAGSG